MTGPRNRLPQSAVQVLQGWVAENGLKTPTVEERLSLKKATGLSHRQVSCWLSNWRRRFSKPTSTSVCGVGEVEEVESAQQIEASFSASVISVEHLH